MQALVTMQQSLRSLVGEVRDSAQSIALAFSEVAAGNLDLSERTEVAARDLQQTASFTSQLTGNVRESAEAAKSASALARDAASVGGRGGEAASQVVSTMTGIDTSSRRIADIIGTIDGIAFQTNILPLNAAVEAARVGE
jgi:methyl-accepting chemotaxis protein